MLNIKDQKKDSKNEEEFLLRNVPQQKKDSKNEEEFLLLNVEQQKKDSKNEEKFLLLNVEQQKKDSKNEEEFLLPNVREQKKDSKNEEEFLLSNVAQQKKDSKNEEEFKNKDNRGGSNKIFYILHSRVFIYCLMRAKNTHIYSQYFMMINEIFKYYNDLELLKRSKLLTIKDDKIDELNNKIDELLNNSNKVLNKLTNVENELTDTNNKLTDTNNKLTDTNNKLDTVIEDRVIFPNKDKDLQTFILFKIVNNSKYKMIYGSNIYINSQVRSIKVTEYNQLKEEKENKLNKNLTEDELELAIKRINRDVTKYLLNKYSILSLYKVPNTYYLRKLVIEKLTGCKFNGSYITLIEKSEKIIIKDINNIYEERKNQDNIK